MQNLRRYPYFCNVIMDNFFVDVFEDGINSEILQSLLVGIPFCHEFPLSFLHKWQWHSNPYKVLRISCLSSKLVIDTSGDDSSDWKKKHGNCFSSRNWNHFYLMSGSCHLDRMSNLKIGVECQKFAIVIFLATVKFYNLGHIQGIIRVHYRKRDHF